MSFVHLNGLKKKIKQLNSQLIINLCGYNFTEFLDKEVQKKINIINFIDIRNMFFHIYPYKIYYYLRYALKKFLYLKKKKYNVINIISGDSYSNYSISLGSRKIYSHSINYDYFLRNKHLLKNINNNNKIVCYLDSGFLYHIDFAIYKKNKDQFNISDFISKLNKFFLYLINLFFFSTHTSQLMFHRLHA
jgi:hypothetical protein